MALLNYAGSAMMSFGIGIKSINSVQIVKKWLNGNKIENAGENVMIYCCGY